MNSLSIGLQMYLSVKQMRKVATYRPQHKHIHWTLMDYLISSAKREKTVKLSYYL